MLAYHAGAEERMAEVTRDFERGEGPAIPAAVRASRHTRVAEPPQRGHPGPAKHLPQVHAAHRAGNAGLVDCRIGNVLVVNRGVELVRRFEQLAAARAGLEMLALLIRNRAACLHDVHHRRHGLFAAHAKSSFAAAASFFSP